MAKGQVENGSRNTTAGAVRGGSEGNAGRSRRRAGKEAFSHALCNVGTLVDTPTEPKSTQTLSTTGTGTGHSPPATIPVPATLPPRLRNGLRSAYTTTGTTNRPHRSHHDRDYNRKRVSKYIGILQNNTSDFSGDEQTFLSLRTWWRLYAS